MLLRRIDRQRDGLAAALEHSRSPLRWIDRGIAIVAQLRRRPFAAVAGVVTAAIAWRSPPLRWLRARTPIGPLAQLIIARLFGTHHR